MSACPPLPTVEQLFSGEYIEVDVDSLVAQEIVIRYIPDHPNGPYMDCILILENEVEPGRIKMTNSWNINNETGETTHNSSATHNKTYLIGHRFFRKTGRYYLDKFIDEQQAIQVQNLEKPLTSKDTVFNNLRENIGDFLEKTNHNKNVKGGTKRKRKTNSTGKRKTNSTGKRKTTKRKGRKRR